MSAIRVLMMSGMAKKLLPSAEKLKMRTVPDLDATCWPLSKMFFQPLPEVDFEMFSLVFIQL